MRASLNPRAVLGLFLGALILCFAPAIHSICVTASTQSAEFSHVMPDGQIMVMGTSGEVPVPVEQTPPSPDLLAVLGVVLLAGGLAMLAFGRALLQSLNVQPQSGSPQRFFRPPPRARPPVALTIEQLCISRT